MALRFTSTYVSSTVQVTSLCATCDAEPNNPEGERRQTWQRGNSVLHSMSTCNRKARRYLERLSKGHWNFWGLCEADRRYIEACMPSSQYKGNLSFNKHTTGVCRRCFVGTLSLAGAMWSSLNVLYLPHRLLLPFTSFNMSPVLDFPILTLKSPVPSIFSIIDTSVVELRFGMYLRKPLGRLAMDPSQSSP